MVARVVMIRDPPLRRERNLLPAHLVETKLLPETAKNPLAKRNSNSPLSLRRVADLHRKTQENINFNKSVLGLKLLRVNSSLKDLSLLRVRSLQVNNLQKIKNLRAANNFRDLSLHRVKNLKQLLRVKNLLKVNSHLKVNNHLKVSNLSSSPPRGKNSLLKRHPLRTRSHLKSLLSHPKKIRLQQMARSLLRVLLPLMKMESPFLLRLMKMETLSLPLLMKTEILFLPLKAKGNLLKKVASLNN
jgi:hypothetical protein